MRPLAPLSPTKWRQWVGEVRGFLWARKHRQGYIVTGSEQGRTYSALPETVWPTKSFEFWAFLMGLLQRIEPETLLEIGSGRSTFYLAEYAHKQGKSFVSIEQSQEWAILTNALARFGGIEKEYVKRVPVGADGFFDDQMLRKSIPESADFLLLDGPNGARDSARQAELYKSLAKMARVAIVDDIHLPTIYSHMDIFRNEGGLRGQVFFRYPVKKHYDNYLAVLYEPVLQPDICSILTTLGIETITQVTEEICVDKRTGKPVPAMSISS